MYFQILQTYLLTTLSIIYKMSTNMVTQNGSTPQHSGTMKFLSPSLYHKFDSYPCPLPNFLCIWDPWFRHVLILMAHPALQCAWGEGRVLGGKRTQRTRLELKHMDAFSFLEGSQNLLGFQGSISPTAITATLYRHVMNIFVSPVLYCSVLYCSIMSLPSNGHTCLGLFMQG